MADFRHRGDPAVRSRGLDDAGARVADDFINHSGDNPTKITIEGHGGSNVGPFSAARSEAEILFKGGTEFEVLSNVLDSSGVRQLVVRELR